MGLTQTEMARLADASKSAQINWEKGSNAPPATALSAYAEAGADVLYIVTGRRAAIDPSAATQTIQADLDSIRRRLLAADGSALSAGGAAISEGQEVERASALLTTLMKYDTTLMTPAQRVEAMELQAIAGDPARLAAFRAADFMQDRRVRERTKDTIRGWFDEKNRSGWYGSPADPVLTTLATLALDYNVPVKMLVELVQDIRDDAAHREKEC